MHIFVLVESREDMGSVDHHPPESIVGLLRLADLTDWRSNLRCYVLLLFNDVFLSELEFEGHFAGIGLDCNLSPKEGLAIEYPGHSKRTREIFFLVAAIKKLVFIDNPLGESGDDA